MLLYFLHLLLRSLQVVLARHVACWKVALARHVADQKTGIATGQGAVVMSIKQLFADSQVGQASCTRSMLSCV
jgi:hypothetical protein